MMTKKKANIMHMQQARWAHQKGKGRIIIIIARSCDVM